MSSAIDKVKAHYQKGLESHEVPEWGMTIWSYPLSIRDQLAIRDLIKASPEGFKSSAATVVVMAMNEKGERLFEDADYEDMISSADRDLVIDVASKLLKTNIDPEAVKKKSETTQS